MKSLSPFILSWDCLDADIFLRVSVSLVNRAAGRRPALGWNKTEERLLPPAQ